ncbi:MAG TPA: branched-chain amino acid ABC transporter permease [Gaiellaceae bacterium]|nr:branched-chain amino acid ABC transporter permease [Gaiellaceae bacterium]
MTLASEAWRRSAQDRWRDLPEQTRRAIVIGAEVVIAIGLWAWVAELGWGFAYVAGFLWTLKVEDARVRWPLEGAMTVLSLVFLTPLGIITAAIFAVQELPHRYRRFALPLGATAAAATYPFYVHHLFTLPIFGAFPDVSTGVVMIVFVMMAVGLNIVVGYAGLLDLGYVAFYAMGAYSAAWFASLQFPTHTIHFGAVGISPDLPGIHLSVWLILAIAAILTAFAGIVIGLPTLRLRGDYLAIVTLGFGEILPQIARNGDHLFGTNFNLTNGPNGITPLDAPGFGQTLNNATGGILPANYLTAANSDRLFFWTAMGLLLITVFCSWRLRDSRLGRAWIAIREDEIAAGAMGIPLMRTKTWAYASGAFFGGIAGAYYAIFKSATFPGDFFFNISVLILCMVILGGMGNIWGVILGAAFLEYLDREGLANTGAWLNTHAGIHFEVPLYATGIYGAIILIVMLFRPEGLIPDRRRSHELHEGVEDEPLYDAEIA